MKTLKQQIQTQVVAVLFAVIALICLTTMINAQDRTTAVLPAKDRTDSFETKIKLIEEAWKRKDYDLVRALTHSIRDTAIQTQNEEESPGISLINLHRFRTVESLGATAARWAQGWKYCKEIVIEETADVPRTSEPVEITLGFPADQATSLMREIRLARIDSNQLVEVPCQVFHEVRRKGARYCKILWMVDSFPKMKQRYLVFYGNPNAELPDYPSELKTEGEGFGLDISNSIYKASLSRQTGQLERLTLRREHGLEIYSGGQGHGEPPGIDWAHDYVDQGGFQKLRISLWDGCPDYEVIRGPVCTIVRRWGLPRSPVYPVYTPSRLNIDVEYRFYAGLPWFHKIGSMTALQDFDAEALRDDEWVFTGQSFTDPLWMDRDGKLQFGDIPAKQKDDMWGVGFFNRDSKDSFIALFLEHKGEGLPELKHNGPPQMYYRWHGSVWSRYPLPVKKVPKGAVLQQKNAYVSIPFAAKESPLVVEELRRGMMNPLVASAGSSVEKLDLKVASDATSQSTTNRLARPGEADDLPLPKQLIWEALRDCKDAQLYTADINVVDLGLIYDVKIRGNIVTIVMAAPHRGRPLAGYFVEGSISVHPTFSLPIRERLLKIPGVKQVVIDQTWTPGWSSNRLSDIGRHKLGLE